MTSPPLDSPTNHPRTINAQNGAPLAAHIAKIISEIRARSPLERIIVVAPSSYSAFFLKRAVTDKICKTNGTGFFNVEFMRIEDVADILFDSSPGRIDGPAMTSLIRFELVQNSVTNLSTSGPLQEHSQNDATIAAVERTLQELSLIEDGAESLLRNLAADSDTGLFAQLLEVQREYNVASARFLRREQKANIAAQTARMEHGYVAKALAPNVVVLNVPDAPDTYTTLRENLQLLPFAYTVNVVPASTSTSNQSESQRTTHFYSAMGDADEPRSLIRNIMRDARNGTKYGEMAVFYPSSDYATRIKDALDAADIPNCGPSARALAETSAGKFVSLFLTMLSEDMRRDTFASWTSSSPVIDPSTGTRVPSVSWQVVSRNAGISRFSDSSDWNNTLERYANSMHRRALRALESDDDDTTRTDPDSFFETANHAQSLKVFLNSLAKRINNRNLSRWSKWVAWLESIIADYSVPIKTSEDDESLGHPQVENALNQLRSIDEISRSVIDFSKFARTVQRLLRTSVGASSGWGTSILVAPISAGTATAFKSTHILGMAEGSLPGPGRSDPLLPDILRRRLDPDSTRLITRSKRLELDQIAFQMALSSAPINHLYWNKALIGSTNESYPSPWFVDEVQKANNETNISVKSLMYPQSGYVESAIPLSNIHATEFTPSSRYEFGLRDIAIRAKHTYTKARVLANPFFAPLADGHAIAQARRNGDFGPFDGNVGSSLILQTAAWHTSATALESYAQCPYRYFLAHELNVDERFDPEESLELSPLDRGTLVHKILEEFLKNHGVDRSENGLKALRDVAKTEIDRFQQQDFIGYSQIFELEKTKLLRDLETWHRTKLDALIGYDGEFKTEESFGRDDTSIGQIQLDDGFTIQLRGQVDLIAISPQRDRALVLDFKTGRSSYTEIEKDITGAGKRLQLPIYSIVANEILGHAADIEAAFWFVFLSGANEFRPKNYVKFDEALLRFQPVITTIIGGIRDGAFPARPDQRQRYNGTNSWKNCNYCPYDTVCTSDRLVSWERKKSAPILEDYVALAE